MFCINPIQASISSIAILHFHYPVDNTPAVSSIVGTDCIIVTGSQIYTLEPAAKSPPQKTSVLFPPPLLQHHFLSGGKGHNLASLNRKHIVRSWGGIFCIGLVCPGASRYFGTFVRIGGYCITRTVELGCGD